MAILPNLCTKMPIEPSRLITAMNILADSYVDGRKKGEGIFFTTPLVDGLRPVQVGDILLVAYEEGVETCTPCHYQVVMALSGCAMQRINALPFPIPPGAEP
jgi:hypothetical protein